MSELDQYDYDLPDELIAQYPMARRSDARLMVVDRARGTWEHTHVRDLPDVLAAGDCLVLNDTRVLPARLIGYREKTHGRWEGLFLSADRQGHWQLLSKTRGKLQSGETIVLQDRQGRESVRLRMLVKLADGRWAASPAAADPPLTLLDRVGRVPLPHYIRGGEMEPVDRDAYQTVFADQPGSVAAPTAGMHFTRPLLEKLQECGIASCRVTLHVGLGTFRPITSAVVADHQMHAEWGSLSAEVADQLCRTRAAGGRVVAVGSTSLRLLETAAADGQLHPWTGETQLFIRPGYEFQATDALLTNFHLPRTTLLVLVRALGGDGLMQRAYQEAIREHYRFFSYGDAMLIL